MFERAWLTVGIEGAMPAEAPVEGSAFMSSLFGRHSAFLLHRRFRPFARLHLTDDKHLNGLYALIPPEFSPSSAGSSLRAGDPALDQHLAPRGAPTRSSDPSRAMRLGPTTNHALSRRVVVYRTTLAQICRSSATGYPIEPSAADARIKDLLSPGKGGPSRSALERWAEAAESFEAAYGKAAPPTAHLLHGVVRASSRAALTMNSRYLADVLAAVAVFRVALGVRRRRPLYRRLNSHTSRLRDDHLASSAQLIWVVTIRCSAVAYLWWLRRDAQLRLFSRFQRRAAFATSPGNIGLVCCAAQRRRHDRALAPHRGVQSLDPEIKRSVARIIMPRLVRAVALIPLAQLAIGCRVQPALIFRRTWLLACRWCSS